MYHNKPIRGAEALMYNNTSSRGNKETVCFQTKLKIRNKQHTSAWVLDKRVKLVCGLFVIII
jgi:hypothetical protein